MITAATARDLALHSEEHIAMLIDKISARITEVASGSRPSQYGNRKLALDDPYLPQIKEFEVVKKPFYAPEYTAVQKLIAAKLTENGFMVGIEQFTKNVRDPDDDSTGFFGKTIEEDAWHIIVRW